MGETTSPPRGTLLNIRLIEEKYGRSLLASICIHAFLFALFLLAPYMMPRATPLQIGTGPGGGSGGEPYTVGIADDLGGGIGMTKPSLTPQPPALPVEKPAKKEEVKPKAIPLPDTVEPKKPPPAPPRTRAKPQEPAAPAESNVIPTSPEPGAGGTGGRAGGSGGGRGGGAGVSIGAGSGGMGDSWYARAVESRVGSNWIRPVGVGQRVEIIYSFVVGYDGTIRDIRKVQSSGNEALDLTAERAIRASNPLIPPPPELRSQPLQFVAQFVYPPNP